MTRSDFCTNDFCYKGCYKGNYQVDMFSPHGDQKVAWIDRDPRDIAQLVHPRWMWVSGIPEPQPSNLASPWHALGKYLWDGNENNKCAEPATQDRSGRALLQRTFDTLHPDQPTVNPDNHRLRVGFEPDIAKMAAAVKDICTRQPLDPLDLTIVKFRALMAWKVARRHHLHKSFSTSRTEYVENLRQIRSETWALLHELDQIEVVAGRPKLFEKYPWTLEDAAPSQGNRKRSHAEIEASADDSPSTTKKAHTSRINDVCELLNALIKPREWPTESEIDHADGVVASYYSDFAISGVHTAAAPEYQPTPLENRPSVVSKPAQSSPPQLSAPESRPPASKAPSTGLVAGQGAFHPLRPQQPQQQPPMTAPSMAPFPAPNLQLQQCQNGAMTMVQAYAQAKIQQIQQIQQIQREQEAQAQFTGGMQSFGVQHQGYYQGYRQTPMLTAPPTPMPMLFAAPPAQMLMGTNADHARSCNPLTAPPTYTPTGMAVSSMDTFVQQPNAPPSYRPPPVQPNAPGWGTHTPLSAPPSRTPWTAPSTRAPTLQEEAAAFAAFPGTLEQFRAHWNLRGN